MLLVVGNPRRSRRLRVACWVERVRVTRIRALETASSSKMMEEAGVFVSSGTSGMNIGSMAGSANSSMGGAGIGVGR